MMRLDACLLAALVASPLAVLPGVVRYAYAESLSGALAANGAVKPVAMRVACGKLDKANCAQVLPRLAQQTAGEHVELKPFESTGSTESATGVCLGLVDGAILQNDAVDLRARQPDCAGKVDVVGRPLYPYYGFLVVSAAAPYDTITRLIEHLPKGKALTVAVGENGSGGAVTMSNLLKYDPAWKAAVATVDYGLETALGRVKDRSLDGFFVMDAPDSPLIERITAEKTADGKPAFKFADVRPSDALYAVKDWAGRPMYQEAVVTPGFLRSTKSVSVDAVVVAANQYREDRKAGGPRVVDALATAINKASAAIIADTKTPRDWTPASARR